jgi:amino acid transporter
MIMSSQKPDVKSILLGKALKNSEIASEKLNVGWGLSIMASDAVSSVAYAIEEILLVLVPVLGMASIGYLNLVALPIMLLLLILAISYSQIIDHYPSGGGAYVVSSENLGKTPALLAASALVVDYVMTVAVSLSSATAAFLSAFPEFTPYRVLIALILLSLITLMNLRGVRESAKIFGLPTYGFILIMMLMILVGTFRLATGTLAPIAYDRVPQTAQNLTLVAMGILMLRAFSSGCSALTGIEAVSNAVPSFKDPSQKVAKRVLLLLVVVIIFIFGGSVLLATKLQVIPQSGQTVVSQMGAAVFGRGILFYILQFMTSIILVLAANTAYNGLPTLLAILAHDNYMPHQFAQRGSKLSFSNGIMFIFFVAGALIILFGASTHALIPLYSVGVFLSFTLAQSGMVIKWMREKEPGWRHRMLINVVGAVMSVVGMIIVFVTKFADGAWMLAIAIPGISILMYYIERHYSAIAKDIMLDVDTAKKIYRPCTGKSSIPCIVLASSFSRPFLKALNHANSVSSDVTVLHIATSDEEGRQFKTQWDACGFPVKLDMIDAPYRDIIPPLEEYLARREATLKSGEFLMVLFVKLVENRAVDNILHNQTTYFIERRLKDFPNVASFIVHYKYNRHASTQAVAEK